MPYKKIKKGKCTKVITAKTKKVHAKCTTVKKADAQIRLLNAIEKKKNKRSMKKK